MDPPSGNINTITIAWFIQEFWKCSRVFAFWVPTFLLPSISKCVDFTVFLPTCVVGGLQKAQLNTLTFVGTLWSRRFPCCPVCSDLPSTKPLATHLLNSILCILPMREGKKKNILDISSFWDTGTGVKSPHTSPLPDICSLPKETFKEGVLGRRRGTVRLHGAHQRLPTAGPLVSEVTPHPADILARFLHQNKYQNLQLSWQAVFQAGRLNLRQPRTFAINSLPTNSI